MAKTKKKEPRDLNKVWTAPLRCLGYPMSQEEILGRLEQKIDLAGSKEAAKPLKALAKRVKNAGDDVQAQRVLYEAGVPYRSGCGVDLRDAQYDLLEKHGRDGQTHTYDCPACGCEHTVKFGDDPTEG